MSFDDARKTLTDSDKADLDRRHHLVGTDEVTVKLRSDLYWKVGYTVEQFAARDGHRHFGDCDLWRVTILCGVTGQEIDIVIGKKHKPSTDDFLGWLRDEITAEWHDRLDNAQWDFDNSEEERQRRKGVRPTVAWDQETADLIEAVLAMTPYEVWAVKNDIDEAAFDDVRERSLEWVLDGGKDSISERSQERFQKACKAMTEKFLAAAKAKHEADEAARKEAESWE